MKNIIGVIAVAAIALISMTSSMKGEKGIVFSKLTMEEAQKKAAKSEKLIFIDAYTDWCGPCKRMAATTFKESEVAEFFNDEFINLKIEMEKNPEGNDIARKYGVRAYPTLLIVDSEGNLVKKTIGFKTKDQLLAFAGSAL